MTNGQLMSSTNVTEGHLPTYDYGLYSLRMAGKFGETLRSLIKERGLTQKKFGEIVGFDQSFISHLVRDKKDPSWQTAVAIADALHVPLEVLAGAKSDEKKASPIELRVTWDTGNLGGAAPPPDDVFLPVPVLDPAHVRIAAGQPQITSREQITDFALIPRRAVGRKSTRGLFCLFVVGDSMEPVLKEDAIVCVDTNIKPGMKPPAESIWAVRDGDGPVVKHIQFSDGELWLLSENRRYPAKKAAAGYEVLGRVVWVWQAI